MARMVTLVAAAVLVSCSGTPEEEDPRVQVPLKELRKTHRLVQDEFTRARDAASKAKADVYLVFQPGRMAVYVETGQNGQWDPADQPSGPGTPIPEGVSWVRSPAWARVSPSGWVRYPSDFVRQGPDVVAAIEGSDLKLKIDVDETQGKVGGVSITREP